MLTTNCEKENICIFH